MSGIVEFTESFEGGTSGTAISTSNTGFSTITGTGTGTFDSSVAADGSLSANIISSGGTGASFAMQRNFTFTQNVLFIRFAMYLPTLPSGQLFIGAGGTSGTNPDMRINTAGTVTIRNNLLAVGTTTNSVPLNSWFLLEWNLNNNATTQSLRLYSGLSGTPLETVSGLYNQGGFSSYKLGITTTLAATIWLDVVGDAFNDWLGPLSDTPIVGWFGA